MSFFYQSEDVKTDKKYGYGIAIGAGILALAAGIIAFSKMDQDDKNKKKLKKAAKKVKRESKKLAALAVNSAEDLVEQASVYGIDKASSVKDKTVTVTEEILEDAKEAVNKTLSKAKKRMK